MMRGTVFLSLLVCRREGGRRRLTTDAVGVIADSTEPKVAVHLETDLDHHLLEEQVHLFVCSTQNEQEQNGGL